MEIKIVEYHKTAHKIGELYNDVYKNELTIVSGEYVLDCYDPFSTHILAEVRSMPVGYLRIIKPNVIGFPALEKAVPDIKIDRDRCVEFSRLLVTKESRKRLRVCCELMRQGARSIREAGFSEILVDVFVSSAADSAMALFLSLGFVPCSDIYFDPRYNNPNPSILMHVDLVQLANDSSRQMTKRRIISHILGQ